jgi:hypothetical protein
MDDPRRFPPAAAAPPSCARLHALAVDSLGAQTGAQSDACDAQIGLALDALLAGPDAAALEALFATAPSSAVYRHLWRLLARRERAGAPEPSHLVRLVAVPVVVVAAAESAAASGTVLPCVLPHTSILSDLLREHRALAGNETVALGNTLVGADALDFARLPELFASRALADSPRARALPPLPITVAGAVESVHLRFLVGSRARGAGCQPVSRYGGRQVGHPVRASAVARSGSARRIGPRAAASPLPLVEAAWIGRVAQREVGAQIFASNAVRKLRAGTGEPSAVISVHRIDGDDAGAEVRLSLSSPFDPRAAEGLRCPLWPLDRVDDVVLMLATLLEDCRVTDVRRKPGVHPDRDPDTGLPLLFKAQSEPPASALH